MPRAEDSRSRDDGEQRGRLSRSGHTRHAPRDPDPAADHPHPDGSWGRSPGRDTPGPNGWGPPAPPPRRPPSAVGVPAPPPVYRPEHPQARHAVAGPARADARPPSGPTRRGERVALTAGAGSRRNPAVVAGRAAATGAGRAARSVTRKVVSASKADGADQSGLTALIWNQVLSYGTDAMITVALAGTVFFGASTHAQRGNVLLYLLITMAPFAVVAPVIGPALDRWQHGRRWTMAGTAVGRAILALVMAAHPTELLVLYPCALGSLVLSKAYSVLRAAAAPRLVPPGMTLTQANARLTIFGLGSTVVLGALVGFVIKTSGSYTLGLWITAIAFALCAYFAARLPRQVDSPTSARPLRHPKRSAGGDRIPLLRRLRMWATRGFDMHVVMALQGESALRLLSGLLTIYLAFWVESTAHGFQAAWELGAVVGAAGVGNFSGTAIGTRLKLARPEVIIVASVMVAAAVCVLTGIFFGVFLAVLGMYVSAVTNAVSKIALDALIQRDVPESLRSSAFARSETFLQLAWVVGAAIGVALPSRGTVGGAGGFWAAAVLVGAAAIVVGLRLRVVNRLAARHEDPPGTVAAGHAGAGFAPPHARP